VTPVTQAIARGEEVLRETRGDRTVENHMFHALAHLRARLGEFDVARDLAHRYRVALWESGRVVSSWWGAEVSADIEMIAGNPAGAANALQEASLNVEGVSADVQAWLNVFLARAMAVMGRIPEAEQAAEMAIKGSEDAFRALAQAALARVRAVQGRHDHAARLIDEATDAFAGTDFVPFRADVLVDRADVMRLAGRPDEAAAAAREALDLYEIKGDVVSAARIRAQMAGA